MKHIWLSYVGIQLKHEMDSLAAYGLRTLIFTWWDGEPPCINSDFCRDRYGFPQYRLS